MATGVTETKPAEDRRQGGRVAAKKNRKWVIIAGGGGAALLLLSHKGGSKGGGSGSPNDQLSAYQQGVNDASNLIGSTTGSLGTQFGPSANADTPTDPGTSPVPATVAATASEPGQIGPIQVDIQTAGGTPPGTGKHATSKPGKKKTTRTVRPGGKTTKRTAVKPRTEKRAAHPRAGTAAPVHRTTPAAAPRPKTAAKTKPAPASKSGGHPNTPRKTPHGAKKHSPAEVESPFGAGSGQLIMGRVFPGAIGHRLGPAQRAADGTITRVVVVDYGGHTDRFLCHGNGRRWTDNPFGMNPPSRGVPFLSDPIPV